LCVAAAEVTDSSTYLRQIKIQERVNSLGRKIAAWILVQQLYMPAVVVIRARTAQAAADAHEAAVPSHSLPLYLPSGLPTRTICDAQLQQYEWRLRFAQAHDALDTLRHHLRLQAHVRNFKYRFDRGQIANLRSNDVISRNFVKVESDVKRYRDARCALLHLSPILAQTGWQSLLPPLLDADVRQMTVGLPNESEGRKTISWIWRTHRVGVDLGDEGLQEGAYACQYGFHWSLQLIIFFSGLRIEWCKARARAMRWSEEVLLLQEEMRRVLAYHTWHALWWVDQGTRWVDLPAARSEGLLAYAHRQAHIFRAMHDDCQRMWKDTSTYANLGYGADSTILNLVPVASPPTP
jgi:hypothetical protein